MLDGKSMRELAEEEKAKWAEMNPKEKRQYFKDYYLVKCIVGFIAFVMLVSILCETVIFRKVSVYSGCTVNITASEEGVKWLTEDYVASLGITSKRKVGYLVDTYINFGENQEEGGEDSETDKYILYTQIASKDFNYLILTEDALYGTEGMEEYVCLQDVLSQDWMDRLSGKLVNLTIEEKSVPAAIDMTGTKLAQRCGFGDQKIYLVFAEPSAKQEKIEQFLHYIFEE